MPDFAPDAFNIWGNFNKDQKKDGHYWAAMEVPVAELRKLVEWVKTADRCENPRFLMCIVLGHPLFWADREVHAFRSRS